MGSRRATASALPVPAQEMPTAMQAPYLNKEEGRRRFVRVRREGRWLPY